jgi:hypothetical protein
VYVSSLQIERVFDSRAIVASEFGCVSRREVLRDHLGLLLLLSILFFGHVDRFLL